MAADEAVGLAVKVKAEAQRFCPYLDSISRHILDFDFEKVPAGFRIMPAHDYVAQDCRVPHARVWQGLAH